MPEIPYSIRDRHVHVIGKTGVGKSTLLAWWAHNDILSNEGGVCVIDPKGDLVELILRYIP
jgi:ABC-type lipoprotein export system ATPase subunit